TVPTWPWRAVGSGRAARRGRAVASLRAHYRPSRRARAGRHRMTELHPAVADMDPYLVPPCARSTLIWFGLRASMSHGGSTSDRARRRAGKGEDQPPVTVNVRGRDDSGSIPDSVMSSVSM